MSLILAQFIRKKYRKDLSSFPVHLQLDSVSQVYQDITQAHKGFLPSFKVTSFFVCNIIFVS